MSTTRYLSVLVMSLALGMPLALLAAEHTEKKPPNLADTWIMHVKHGHESQFEAAFKAHVEARKAAGDPRAWQVFTPVIGDDFGHYVVRSCCFDWPDMDAYDAWSQASKMGEHWNENVHPHVKRYEHYLVALDFENSHWPEENPGFEYFGVSSWDIKPGGYRTLEAARVGMSKTAKEHGWSRHWSWSWPIGGRGGLMLVSPYVNYAGMAPPEQSFSEFLAENLGEEAAGEMMSNFGSNLMDGSYTVYRHRKDLSMAEE